MGKFFSQRRVPHVVGSVLFQMFVIIFLLWERNVLAETKPPIIQSPKQADSLMRILQTSSLDDTNRVKIDIRLAKYYRSVKRDFDSALFYVEDAYKRAMAIDFKHGVASAHLQRGLVFYYQTKITLSESNLYAALKLFQDLQDKRGMAEAYTHLGMINTHGRFEYVKAISMLLKALSSYQQIGDSVASKSAVHNLGWIYDHLGYNSKAIEYYSKALQLSELEDNKIWIAYAAITLGDMYVKVERFDKAEPLFNLSSQIYRESHDSVMILELNISKGKMFVKQGNIGQARDLFEQTLKKSEKMKAVGGKALLLYHLASIYSTLNNHKQALVYAERGYKLCDSVEWGQHLPRADFLMVLSTSYEALGYPQKALECYRNAEIINKSVLNADVIRQLDELSVQNEIEKQERTIALLRAEQFVKDSELQIKRLSQWLLILIVGILVLLLLWLYEHYREKKKTAENLTIQNSFLAYQTQMHEVESQLAPHFLFNSLSALGGLISRDAKKEAIEFLENLALTYRYVLTHKQQHLVTLESEMDFVHAYIYLFTTRFREGLQIQIDIDKQFNQYSLPPMTLQLLVENALKHNIATANKPLHIVIHTEGSMTEARLVVQNNLQIQNSQMGYKAMMGMSKNVHLNAANKEPTRLGLQNLSIRYQLFARRLPSIEKTETEFIVSVPLLSPEEVMKTL